MAGLGQRFVNDGYPDPKPLIHIRDINSFRMIIEHVLEMFEEPDDEFVFICNDVHVETTKMVDIILDLKPNSVVLSMPQHKKGPVWTVKPAYEFINDDEEVIVSYCDGTIRWDRNDFRKYVDDNQLDACLITHSGFHPHVLSTTKMAFLKEENGLVVEIKEKESYTDNPMGEHASSGQYYFRKGSYVKKYFDEAIDKNINYNGEHYITLAYNLLIQDGLRVGYYDTSHVAILGTPEEVRNFEAWGTIIKGSQVKNESDLLKCYEYWKGYYNK
jgi:NDP-sugar pyrophosphorylase family protein